MSQKITPFLWFDRNAEEAARYYVSIFKGSKITAVTRYSAEGPRPEGSVMTVEFLLEGQRFTALNGGPQFQFNQSVSFVVRCKTQKEIDETWGKLTAGGEEIACGWLKDKYGLVWQVVPESLLKMLQDKDAEKTGRVIKAIMGMKKLDLEALKRAYHG